jgi:glycosyltransferase involved in cell wall biosynthesis
VTAYHVQTSEGGLLYEDPTSFEVALSLLLEQPQLREQMAANGREYATSRYLWDDKIDHLVRCISEWAVADAQVLS